MRSTHAPLKQDVAVFTQANILAARGWSHNATPQAHIKTSSDTNDVKMKYLITRIRQINFTANTALIKLNEATYAVTVCGFPPPLWP